MEGLGLNFKIKELMRDINFTEMQHTLRKRGHKVVLLKSRYQDGTIKRTNTINFLVMMIANWLKKLNQGLHKMQTG